jgi:kumamolisin
MVVSSKMIAVSGSNRPPMDGAKLLRKSDPKQSIKVSIYLRRSPKTASEAMSTIATLNAQPPQSRRYLTKTELASMFGADPKEVEAVEDWAKSCKLKVIDADAGKRRVQVEGSVAAMNKAFGVQLNDYRHPEGYEFRGREGEVHVPESLYGIVESVLGFDTRRVGRPRLRRARVAPVDWMKASSSHGHRKAAGPSGTNPFPGTFFPPQVAALYNYPPNLTGSGQNVAIMSFNGAPDGNPHGGYNLAAPKHEHTRYNRPRHRARSKPQWFIDYNYFNPGAFEFLAGPSLFTVNGPSSPSTNGINSR